MVHLVEQLSAHGEAAPRTRGDGPGLGVGERTRSRCSPHPRGWSPGCRHQRGPGRLLPAPAGMVPATRPPRSSPPTAPRTRGDGPLLYSKGVNVVHCSPHPRGWSPANLRCTHSSTLLPAPAGMVPRRSRCTGSRRPAPRTHGYGPRLARHVLGTLACSRHLRGSSGGSEADASAPPHPRGWSPVGDDVGARFGLLSAPARMAPSTPGGAGTARSAPAPAGMVPTTPRSSRRSAPAPCTRRDSPGKKGAHGRRRRLLPAPAGMARDARLGPGGGVLLPSPAGMVPRLCQDVDPWMTAPLTRGDSPGRLRTEAVIDACSPHLQGWPRFLGCPARPRRLLPAPAGIAPSRSPCTER